MRKAIIVVAALMAVQGLLLLVWLGVGRDRGDEVRDFGRLAAPAPEFTLFASDGSELRLSGMRGSTVVLHFWATWCPPCRDELPSLLEYGSAADVELLAVSVDPQWGAVREFVGEGLLEQVYLAPSDEVFRAFGVEELPQTFVVDPAGGLCLHFRDARDWDSPAIRELVAACRDR